jgi:hypothetical protein
MKKNLSFGCSYGLKMKISCRPRLQNTFNWLFNETHLKHQPFPLILGH